MGAARKLQASDNANQWMIGFLVFTVLISILYLINLVWNTFVRRRRETVPQALEMESHQDEGPEEGTPASSMNAQNVQFTDAHPGFTDERGWTNGDPLRDTTLMKDALLENFFSRPIKVAEIEWPVGTGVTLNTVIDPWTLYFENKRVINRITNYKLMKANLRVKFMLNGNSFYYGRLLASYKPLPNLDSTTLLRPGVAADFVEATQRPHVFLNPTESQGGELFLPFFTPLNMLDVAGQGWEDMGQVTISTLQPLKHANGATQSVTVSVFVWAENVDLSVLTQTDPGTIVPQAKEEWQGIVSKPASAVAKVAGALKGVPGISNFAIATEIGANSIAKMAALFGYSKPAVPEICPLQPMTRQSMADTDGKENLVKLVVDTKNELTIDPSVAGIEAKDELVIHQIASRESYLTSFDWNVGTNVEQLLFNTVVDPCIFNQNGATNPEIHMPACCFATFPFEYWKGSLKYRFQIVCSGYHKGRLKFVYDPVGTPQDGSSEYNTAYTQIVDIAENNDFCIEVGWGQTTPWRHHLELAQSPGTFYGPNPVATNTLGSNRGNGTLSVYVVNELTVPNSTVDNDIQINVFISACDDFEVAAPTDYYLGFLGFQPPAVASATSTLRGQVVPQSEEIDDVPIAGPPVLNHMGPECPTDSLVNRIHMGEAITSFRTLLKRYNLHEILAFDEDVFEGTGAIVKFTRTMFPITPGYTPFTNADNNIIQDISSGSYVYAKMTLLNYLKPAFGGWRGSVRYTTDATFNVVTDSSFDNPTIGDSTWSVSRISPDVDAGVPSIPVDDVTYPSVASLATQKRDILFANRYSSGVTGATRWTTKVNPIQSYEIPYYSQFRFAPGKRGTQWTSADIYQPSYELLGTCIPGLLPFQLYNYVAAGEDFTFLFYLSPPIFYLQTLPVP
jgi:hypothetical protein